MSKQHIPIRTLQEFEDLAPFLRMTVVAGVTIGDTAFASAQSLVSTTYFQPTTTLTINANLDLDLYQSAIGDGGQGLAAGQLMTRSQTNVVDSNGKMGANECFVAVKAGFAIYRHRTQITAATYLAGAVVQPIATNLITPQPIPVVGAVRAIAQNLSWKQVTGDGIERNYGPLGDYPFGGGGWDCQDAAATLAHGANNGKPTPHVMTKLPLPIVFPPSIRTQIKVVSGGVFTLAANSIVVDAGAGNANDCLAIRCVLQGYRLTMPTIAG